MIAGVTSTWECPLCGRRGVEHCHPGERQTPACCVGDSLKECQRKHSQTTCSPRAEGLASLQAHLHTIPQLLASQPRRQSGAKEGEGKGRREEFTDGENLLLLWRRCRWWKWWHLKETVEREDHENLLPVCKVHTKFCVSRLTAIFAAVHGYHTTRFARQGLLGYGHYPTCPYPWEKMDCCINQAPDAHTATLCICSCTAYTKYSMPVIFQQILPWHTHSAEK